MTEKDEEYLVLSNNHNNYQYARAGSNESSRLRNSLIDRHKGASCTITASGMQAISAVLHGIFIEHKFEHFHLVYANELYLETPGFFSYLKDLYNNLTLHAVDVRQPDTILDLFKTTIKGQPAIIFTESCSNPNGYIFDFSVLEKIKNLDYGFMARWKKVSKLLYVIVDNTWLTDAIFQPFDIPEVDFVINSLTKYYSGGACIAGVVLGRAHNVMNKVTNWSARNGNHVSPHNCELVVQKLPQLDERIAITSALTLRIIDYLKTKEIVTNISHPVCENHPSHQLAKKYFKQELVPSTFSISIGRKFDFVYKAVKKATILECKTSFGSRMSRTNIWSNQEAGTDSTIVRLSIGYEDNYDRIVSGLDEIFIKLDEK